MLNIVKYYIYKSCASRLLIVLVIVNIFVSCVPVITFPHYTVMILIIILTTLSAYSSYDYTKSPNLLNTGQTNYVLGMIGVIAPISLKDNLKGIYCHCITTIAFFNVILFICGLIFKNDIHIRNIPYLFLVFTIYSSIGILAILYERKLTYNFVSGFMVVILMVSCDVFFPFHDEISFIKEVNPFVSLILSGISVVVSYRIGAKMIDKWCYDREDEE